MTFDFVLAVVQRARSLDTVYVECAVFCDCLPISMFWQGRLWVRGWRYLCCLPRREPTSSVRSA
jgi:hypothetical protein